MSKVGGRDYNQDYVGFWLSDDGGCFVVCDGLGAYRGSEDASRIAVEAMLAFFKEAPDSIGPYVIEENLKKTHKKIIDHKRHHPEISSSCTTIASLFVAGDDITVAHIGDTRCYFFQNHKLVLYTVDHSVSQMAVHAGEISREQIRFHEDRNKLLRVLGSERLPHADFHQTRAELGKGDFFLLCSDGFWEYVTEEEMEEDSRKATGAADWLKRMEKRLLKRVPRHNDNYSAVAVKICSETPSDELQAAQPQAAATSPGDKPTPRPPAVPPADNPPDIPAVSSKKGGDK